MRKQTKIVAVASAAALLAIGASMTAFAATGWVEEDGTWYYYDRDENRVEDEWKRSGDNWYWLSSEEGGAMAVDTLVEDDNDTYYVDTNGVMVRNTWIKVVNEDQDEDEDPAEYHYYYMQSNGKAYKGPDSGATRFKTIDGKRYAFDEDGVMLYGWVNESGERLTDEEEWEEATYYLGNWDDGSMKTGWQKIYVYDADEDDDMDHWFYFKSNGKKEQNDDDDLIEEKKINGKKYGFDSRGVMVYQWTLATGDASESDGWRYFNDPEDGARATKGWFKVVAPSDDNDNAFTQSIGDGFASVDADDETERWYYADGDGQLYEGAIKKIKGKYYGFRPENDGNGKGAAMLSGLVLLTMNEDTIVDVVDDSVDSDELDNLIKGDLSDYDGALAEGTTLFYFGSSDDEDVDGAMKIGATTINVDGNSYQFLFSKTGGAEGKGRGVTGIDDNKYIYAYGCKIKAGSDDKYVVVKTNNKDTADPAATAKKISSADIRKELEGDIVVTDIGTNKDGDSVMLAGPDGAVTNKEAWSEAYYLVNTSGAIVKGKTAAKDGDDWYFYVDDKNIKMYTNNKNLKNSSTSGGTLNEKNLNDWKNWTPSN